MQAAAIENTPTRMVRTRAHVGNVPRCCSTRLTEDRQERGPIRVPDRGTGSHALVFARGCALAGGKAGWTELKDRARRFPWGLLGGLVHNFSQGFGELTVDFVKITGHGLRKGPIQRFQSFERLEAEGADAV